jgi:hypothetical protein
LLGLLEQLDGETVSLNPDRGRECIGVATRTLIAAVLNYAGLRRWFTYQLHDLMLDRLSVTDAGRPAPRREPVADLGFVQYYDPLLDIGQPTGRQCVPVHYTKWGN